MLAPSKLVVGPGKGVVAGSAAELLIVRWKNVEEVKLALAGKDLVIPLDMLQNRGADALGGRGDHVVRGEVVGQPVGLDEAELPYDRAAQPGCQGSTDRQPVPGSHRHAKESDVLSIDPARTVDRCERVEPVVAHAAVNVCGAHAGDPGVVVQRAVAVNSAVAVKRAVDRQGRDPGGCAEPSRQPHVTLASLVATATVPKQHHWRGRAAGWAPQRTGHVAPVVMQHEAELIDRPVARLAGDTQAIHPTMTPERHDQVDLAGGAQGRRPIAMSDAGATIVR